ncbi:MAG: DUF1636 domain-containing protein [Methylobacteriaceae bacterium]|nr:DUF1636 domain-containing protein [Methylobacteriaceae bacterium]
MSDPSVKGAAGTMQVYVCVTCRRENEPLEPREARSGARLFAAFSKVPSPTGVQIIPVECLSVCRRPCTIAFAAPGKWTYVYGDFFPEASVDIIFAGAQLYAEAPDGVIPWRTRPLELRRGVVARIPPLRLRPGAAESKA